jgi:outer membrane protein
MALSALLTITVSSYTALALITSPEVRQAEEAGAAAEALYKQSWSDLAAPTLSATGDAYPYGHDVNDGYRTNHGTLKRRNVDLDVTANWNLFNSGLDLQRKRGAEAARDAAARAVTAARQDRAFAAIRAFYDLSNKSELLEVARQNLKGQQAQYEQSKDLYENGMRSLADLLKSETDWRSSQLRLAFAEGERKSSLAAFNVLVDRPPLEEAALTVDLSTAAVALPDVGSDFGRAVAQRAEARRARRLADQSRVAFQQAVQGLLPIFKADATWNSSLRSTSGVPNPNHYLGLSLSLPLGFNGFSQGFAILNARATRRAAEEAARLQERVVRQEVAQAFIDLERALKSYEVAQQKLAIARRTLDLVTSQFRQGSSDAIRMNQAQNDFLDARVQLSQALHTIFIFRAQYTRAVGDPLW